MSSSIRLITDEATVYLPSIELTHLIEQKNSYIVPRPKGQSIIVGFVLHTQDESKMVHEIVPEAIKRGVGVVYICDKLPIIPIIDPHVTYVLVQWKWLIHTLFFNPLCFKGCFYTPSLARLAKAFSSFTKYQIPVLDKPEQIAEFSADTIKSTNNVVVEIMGGLGDHILCIPAIKSLDASGKRVTVLCEKHLNPCFENLPYIAEVINKRELVDVSKFDRVFNLNFGQLLNDYRLDLNKQNRIYSVANVCNISKEQLKYDIPEIILSQEEKEEADKNYGNYTKKIFLGWDSNRTDTRIPKSVAQKLISRLKKKGFTVFTSSLREVEFEDCVNLNKKLSIRQLFMLLSQMDSVLTVDSSFLHIAAAFNIKTFLLMNYFDPDWRCSTYPSVTPYTPKVRCYPCVSGQYVCGNDRVCSGADSCFNYFNWDNILKDIYNYFRVTDSVKTSVNEELREIQDSNCSNIYYKDGLKLLVNRTSGFGDILMVTSLLNTVKKINPSSIITVRTNHPKVLEDVSSVDNIIGTKFAHVEDLSPFSKEYDLILDLQYAVESKKVSGAYGKILEEDYMKESRIDLFHKFAGIPESNIIELSYSVAKDEAKIAKKTLSKLRHDKTIVIAINSTSPYRTYPVDLAIHTISKLIKNYNIICLGNVRTIWEASTHPFTKKYIAAIKEFDSRYFLDLTDKTSIREACALVSESELLIAPDSGLLHVANAVGTKAIGLFGNIDPYLRCSFYGNTVCMSKNMKCLCGDRFYVMKFSCPSFSDIEDPDIQRIGADCMRFIKPDSIVDNVESMLNPLVSLQINSKDLLLPFCENRGVIVSKSMQQKVNKEDIIVDNINTIDKLNILNLNYIYLDNYLTSLNSEYEMIEVLSKSFSSVNYNGMVIIKNKIPFVIGELTNSYDKNFCLLYIKQLLNRTNINYEEVYRIDLLPNGEFLLILRRLK